MEMHHYGNPCIHCGTPHDEVAPCQGDRRKVTPIAYRSLGVRWDGVETFLVRFSDGHVEERTNHISYNAPYYHFGYSDTLICPPRYDETIKM